MSNIEIVDDFINDLQDFELNKETIEVANAWKDILAEREADKKKLKELEAKLEFKKWGDLDNIQFEEYMKEFIPKQKIKNRIRENKRLIDETDCEDMTQKLTDENETLQELLEDK